jgi:serine/threonine-protein kinase
MGEVYRARDTNLNRDVALKILPESFAADADRLARFKREAQVLASLNHPNIAAIYGLERSEGTTALVMELVEGEDLSVVIASAGSEDPALHLNGAPGLQTRGIPFDDALPIARQIIDALDAAHEQGIVHRDLKPANVKVRPDGTVKVLDFGLAKAIEPAGAASASASMSPTITTPAMTEMGMILGTAAYMSPEQAKGRVVDKRADIWAFGCVLYEMLTGHRAFAGEDVSDTLAAVLRADVNFDALPADTPSRVRQVLAACLQRSLKQRVPDIGAVRLALDGAFETTLTETRVDVAAVVPAWRRALPVAVTAVVVSLAAGLAAWTFWPPAESHPVVQFSIPLPEDQAFTNAGRRVVAVSPDGSNLVYVANQRLYLRPMSGLEAHEILGSADTVGGAGRVGVLSPTFSPDGQLVAFHHLSDRKLKTLPIGGGTPLAICDVANIFGLSWDASGLLFGQRGQGILRVPATGGQPEVIVAAGANELLAHPQMLPGGRAVLFSAITTEDATATFDQAAVVVQPLDGGPRKTVIEGGWDGRYLPTGHLVYAVQGVLWAVPFDLGSLSVTGGRVAVVEGIRRAGTGLTSGQSGLAQFSYSSATGALAFLPGPADFDASSADDRDLVIVDRQGVTTPLGLPPRSYRSPRVSQDGHFVTFDTDDAAVWVYALDGGTRMRQITFEGRNQHPIWSADGQFVAFQSDRDGDLGIFRQRADGSSVAERLTTAENGAEHMPEAFSPDGAHLLYTVRQGSQWTLWTMAMQDRTATAFGGVRSEGRVQGAFSPDGHWVAYQEQGNNLVSVQTFLQPFPAVPGVKHFVSGGGQPRWSPNGDQLTLNVGPGRSVIFPISTSPALAVGQPVEFLRTGWDESNPVTTRRNADSLPGGTRIIGVTSGSATPASAIQYESRITVVLNWFDELKARVR